MAASVQTNTNNGVTLTVFIELFKCQGIAEKESRTAYLKIKVIQVWTDMRVSKL